MPISKFYQKNDIPVRLCGTGRDGATHKGRQHLQNACYIFISKFCKGKTVLDVGSGLGKGLKTLAKTALSVRGIDKYDDRLKEFGVEKVDIKDVPDKSYDIVSCVDVIEHVKDDIDLLNDLKRVARELVFVTTPNYNFTKCNNRYHYREYTPEEFIERLNPTRLFTTTASGAKQVEIIDIEKQKDQFKQHLCGIFEL